MCQTAIDDSRSTAEKWLQRFMLNDNLTQAGQVARWLSDGQTYKSHGKPIDFQETHEKLKLNIERQRVSSLSKRATSML